MLKPQTNFKVRWQ